MKIESNKKQNSFRAPLLELVIIIGIFAIVSVYLLKMFMASDKLRGNAVNTTKSVLLAQSVADFIKGCDSDQIAEILSKTGQEFDCKMSGNVLTCGFSKGFEKTDDDPAFILKAELYDGTGLITGYVGIYSADGEKTYCRLDVSKEKKQ
jgi:hypothetical protein